MMESIGVVEEAAKELSELAGNAAEVILRTTYNVVTPESAEDGDYAEHGWIAADGHTQHPMGDDVGPQVTQPGHPWRVGRDASTITLVKESDESLEDFVERVAEETIDRAWGCDHAQREADGCMVAGHPGDMDADGNVESRCVHVEASPDLSSRLLSALGVA